MSQTDQITQAGTRSGGEAGAWPETAGCPAWCVLDHTDGCSDLSHEGESFTLAVSRAHSDAEQSMEVRTVQYPSADWRESDFDGRPFIEVAHHVDGRYRVINLTKQEARELAQTLLRCADQAY